MWLLADLLLLQFTGVFAKINVITPVTVIARVGQKLTIPCRYTLPPGVVLYRLIWSEKNPLNDNVYTVYDYDAHAHTERVAGPPWRNVSQMWGRYFRRNVSLEINPFWEQDYRWKSCEIHTKNPVDRGTSWTRIIYTVFTEFKCEDSIGLLINGAALYPDTTSVRLHCSYADANPPADLFYSKADEPEILKRVSWTSATENNDRFSLLIRVSLSLLNGSTELRVQAEGENIQETFLIPLYFMGRGAGVQVTVQDKIVMNKGDTVTLPCSYTADAGYFSRLEWSEVYGRFGYKVYLFSIDVDRSTNPPNRTHQEMLRYSRVDYNLVIASVERNDEPNKCCNIRVKLPDRRPRAAAACTRIIYVDFPSHAFGCQRGSSKLENDTEVFVESRKLVVNCGYDMVYPAADLLLYKEGNPVPLDSYNRSQAAVKDEMYILKVDFEFYINDQDTFILQAVGDSWSRQFFLHVKYTPGGVPTPTAATSTTRKPTSGRTTTVGVPVTRPSLTTTRPAPAVTPTAGGSATTIAQTQSPTDSTVAEGNQGGIAAALSGSDGGCECDATAIGLGVVTALCSIVIVCMVVYILRCMD